MGLTSYYKWPYPDSTSTVDVPRDIQALADKLETLKNGFRIPTGNMDIGDPAQTGQRFFTISQKVGVDAYELRMLLDTTGYGMILNRKNGVEITRLIMGVDGGLYTYTSGQQRPVPFATQTGTITIAVSATASGTGTATFTAGRFTRAPVVVATANSGSGAHTSMYGPKVFSTTATGFSASATQDASTFSTALTCNYIAMQETEAVALRTVDTMSDDDGTTPRTVTCHVVGCANADIPLELPVPEGAAVTCGPCGNLIDDIV
jgi:hypothetical protein